MLGHDEDGEGTAPCVIVSDEEAVHESEIGEVPPAASHPLTCVCLYVDVTILEYICFIVMT